VCHGLRGSQLPKPPRSGAAIRAAPALGTSEIDNGSFPRRPWFSAQAIRSEGAELAIDQSRWALVGLASWRWVHLGIRE
jgi:hypothetical protein